MCAHIISPPTVKPSPTAIKALHLSDAPLFPPENSPNSPPDLLDDEPDVFINSL